MTRYALQRLAASVPLLLVISILCFGLLHLAPGGPFDRIGPNVHPEDVERLRRMMGLDDPLPVQYLKWLGRTLRGDLGTSLVTGERVDTMIRARLPATVELLGTSLVLSLVAGVALGVIAALHRGRLVDRVVGATSVLAQSVPVFWLGVVAIAVFAARLGWLPTGGRGTPGEKFSPGDYLLHLLLPVLVLTFVQIPQWSRTMRASLLDVLGDEHVRAARARGLSEARIILRHALPPALVPVITLLGLQVPVVFTGAAITETVFAWPGIGRLFYEGALRFDYWRLMGLLLVASVLVVGGNLAADLTNARLDPRIRFQGKQ